MASTTDTDHSGSPVLPIYHYKTGHILIPEYVYTNRRHDYKYFAEFILDWYTSRKSCNESARKILKKANLQGLTK